MQPEQKFDIVPAIFGPGGDLDYSRGSVFGNVRQGINTDIDLIMGNVWQHPDQLIVSKHVDGRAIFKTLVSSFDYDSIDPGTIHLAQPEDYIHGHGGIDTLCFIYDHWNNLPARFRRWASHRRLYAAASAFWGDEGAMYIPLFTAISGVPKICGHNIYLDFKPEDVFLRD